MAECLTSEQDVPGFESRPDYILFHCVLEQDT
jgi:hypothetical protein